MRRFKLDFVVVLLSTVLLCGCQKPSIPERASNGHGSVGSMDQATSSPERETSDAPDGVSGSEDQAIVKLVDSYVDAFNKGDAATVAGHWSKDCVYVNRTTGERLIGREAVEASFAEMFADGPVGELEVQIESIRFVTPDVAVEDGAVHFVAPTGPVDTTSYTAIYVREESEWKLESIRETASPAPPTNYELLSEWEWMVGYWTDELEDWRVETNCEWAANRNFLTRTFKVTKGDETQVQGTQVIGYDPIADTFRCWVFHSGGGFGDSSIQFTNGRFTLASADNDSKDAELGYYPIHRSKEGKWTIDTIGEVTLPVAQSSEEMKQLEWMVGQWVDKDEHATIETTCSWTPNKAFLRRVFSVSVQDRVDLAGVQVLGWDPRGQRFRSWVFGSAGGFANDEWSKEGDRWIVKSAGVLFGGQKSTSVRIITPIDDDTATMEVVDREVGGELLPDIDKVTIVRQKPSE